MEEGKMRLLCSSITYVLTYQGTDMRGRRACMCVCICVCDNKQKYLECV